MEGLGGRPYGKLINSIEAARHTTLPRLIYGLGIANIGLANAKMICKEYRFSLQAMMEASVEELSQVDGIGPVIATAFYNYFRVEDNKEKLDHLLTELHIETEVVDEENETFWLTQEQIAQLFERDRTVINRHLKNIFKEGELDEKVVCAFFYQSINIEKTLIKVFCLDILIISKIYFTNNHLIFSYIHYFRLLFSKNLLSHKAKQDTILNQIHLSL